MEVRKAEAFLAVAEELHFGTAAQRLRMAQPPLSRLIKQLEDELGAELFIRSTRHVELTEAGRTLVEPARRLIAASREAAKAVSDSVSGSVGNIRVGFAGASSYHIIGEIMKLLRQRRPGISLDVHSSMFAPDGIRKVLDKELDLAIGRWDFLPSEVDSHVLFLEDVILALPPNHRLVDQPTVSMAELADDPWVSLPLSYESAMYNRMTNLAVVAGFVPRIIQRAPDSWALMVLVAANAGCTVTVSSVPKYLPDLGAVFKKLSDANNPPIELRLIWRKDSLTPAMAAAIDVVRELYPEPRRI